MDRFIAYVQAILTLLIVGAWILLKVIALLGYGDTDATAAIADDMKEVVMLAVGFWLLRPRAPSPPPPEQPPPARREEATGDTA